MAVSYVASVQDGRVVVEVNEDTTRELVASLGGRKRLRPRRHWVVDTPDRRALAAVLGALRDAAVPMGGGSSGWPPADVFRQLRDEGLLAGPFDEILWREPADPYTVTDPGPRPTA